MCRWGWARVSAESTKGVVIVIERIKHIAVLVAATVALSGCGLLQSELLSDSFWDLGLLRQINNDQAELGIA